MLSGFFRYLMKSQVIFAVFLIALGWFVFSIRNILVDLFIAYIIAVSIFPLSALIRKLKIPKAISVVLAYLIFLALLFLFIVPLIPFLVSQIQLFFSNLPDYLNKTVDFFGLKLDLSQVGTFISPDMNSFGNIGKNVIDVTGTVFGSIFSMITVIVVSFYLLLDYEKIQENIAKLFSEHSQKRVASIISQIDQKLGAWMRGQILLSLSIGILTYIALIILKIEYALPLAMLAGLLEIIPTIGPIISAIPAVLLALTISPNLAIFVIIAYLVIHQLENNVLVPRIMHQVVGLNPIIIIIGVVIGTKLMGILGALLSVPFLSVLFIIFSELKTPSQK
ncbi:MAG: AI-2E family transporter [Patescibacteria group bacterium]|nr:AI-2E family transporter [Patescibacteria group bacterium]